MKIHMHLHTCMHTSVLQVNYDSIKIKNNDREEKTNLFYFLNLVNFINNTI